MSSHVVQKAAHPQVDIRLHKVGHAVGVQEGGDGAGQGVGGDIEDLRLRHERQRAGAVLVGGSRLLQQLDAQRVDLRLCGDDKSVSTTEESRDLEARTRGLFICDCVQKASRVRRGQECWNCPVCD